MIEFNWLSGIHFFYWFLAVRYCYNNKKDIVICTSGFLLKVDTLLLGVKFLTVIKSQLTG